MEDIERIQQLVAEGRITPADGERLMTVLRDIDAADFALDSAAAGTALADEPAADAQIPISPLPPDGGQPEVAAAEPPSSAATDHIEERRRRFEEHERRRLERLQRDAERRQALAERELQRFEHDSQREAERQAERSERDADRERLREAVRASTQAANEAAREVARRAKDAGRQAVAQAKAVSQEVAAATQDRTAPAAGGQGGAPQSTRSIAPEGTRWVTIDVLSGDVDVYAVAGLSQPEVESSGSISAVETDYGYLVRQAPERGSVLDRFLANVRSSSITVRIPAEYGLNLRATAGDIDLHGVKYLQGRVTAGDLRAAGLEGIDFTTMAGNLDLQMTLKEGDHSLTGATGDIDVALGADSDVTIDGSVSIGNAHASHPAIRSQRQTLGERLSGTLGNGTASLHLRVTTGGLGIKVADPRREG